MGTRHGATVPAGTLSLPLPLLLLLLPLLAASSAVFLQGTEAYAEPEFSFKFGTTGDGADELDGPTDVTLDGDGKSVYVVDSQNGRISVFDDGGRTDFRYGTSCDVLSPSKRGCHDRAHGARQDGDGQFLDPFGMAAGSDGNFLVADSGNKRVQVFDDDGRFQSKFGSADRRDGAYLGQPMGIAVHEATGNVLVSDAGEDAVSVFDGDGSFVLAFSPPDRNGGFRDPSGMAVADGSRQTLFVADTGNDRIVMFELTKRSSCPDGTTRVADGVCFAGEFGSRGSGEGEFDAPTGLAADRASGLLYVSDTDNDRIQVFKTGGGDSCEDGTKRVADGVCFVDEFGSRGERNGQFNAPMGVALDASRDLLFVADSNNDRIQVFKQVSSSSPSSPATSRAPDAPDRPRAVPVSPTSMAVLWNEPDVPDKTPGITGYKVQFRQGSSGSYTTITEDTASAATTLIHKDLDPGQRYSYRVYSVSPEGTSPSPSPASSPASPGHTKTPTALSATAIAPSQIRLSWMPPSDTFGQSISGYEIGLELSEGVHDTVGSTNGKTGTYTVTGLTTGQTYTYVVKAKMGYGVSDPSNPVSATPAADSAGSAWDPVVAALVVPTAPTAPIKLTAQGSSSTQIDLSWRPPADDGNSAIKGYKIESRKDGGQFRVIVGDTGSASTEYSHTSLGTGTKYTYRVSAINAEGTGPASNEDSASPKAAEIRISPVRGTMSADEGKRLGFTAKLAADSVRDGVVFTLQKQPAGARIDPETGAFAWTPSSSDGARTYTFDIVAKKGSMSDRETVTVRVKDTIREPEPEPEPRPEPEPEPRPEPTTGTTASPPVRRPVGGPAGVRGQVRLRGRVQGVV